MVIGCLPRYVSLVLDAQLTLLGAQFPRYISWVLGAWMLMWASLYSLIMDATAVVVSPAQLCCHACPSCLFLMPPRLLSPFPCGVALTASLVQIEGGVDAIMCGCRVMRHAVNVLCTDWPCMGTWHNGCVWLTGLLRHLNGVCD